MRAEGRAEGIADPTHRVKFDAMNGAPIGVEEVIMRGMESSIATAPASSARRVRRPRRGDSMLSWSCGSPSAAGREAL